MAKAISNIDISVILSKLHASCSWHSNLYSINQDAINEYLINKTGYDVLANIENEAQEFFDFLTLIQVMQEKRQLQLHK